MNERTFEDEMDDFFINEKDEYLSTDQDDSDSSSNNINYIIKSKIKK